jgi:signal transduction histidine kinase/ActR/RegA family two-component response regulator/Flp pilus assembly protein TadD
MNLKFLSLLLLFCFFSLLVFSVENTSGKMEISFFEIDSLIRIGEEQVRSQSYEPAIHIFNRALQSSFQLKYDEGIAKAYLLLGNAYRLSGNNTESLESFSVSLEKYQKLNNSVGIAESWNGIGLIHTNMGDYPLALEYFFKALDVFKRHKKDWEAAYVLMNIGRLYNMANELDKALEYTEQSLAINRKIDKPVSLANVLNNLGVIYRKMGEADKALSLYLESLEIQRSLNDKTGIANALNNIGIIYHSKDQSEKAIQYFREALVIREELGDESGVAMGLYNLGFMYSVIENQNAALDYFLKSIKKAESIRDNNFRIRGYEALSEQYQKMGDYKKALLYYEKFHRLNDSLFNENSKSQLLEIQTRYETAQKEKELIRTRQVSMALGALLIMSLAFVLSVYISHRKNKRANRALKKQNKEIRQQKKRLEDAKREVQKNLQLKELFFAAANHELRLPLNIILGFTELLDSKTTDRNLKNYIESIKLNGKALQKLVDDILDLSSIDSGNFKLEPEPVNIQHLAKDVFSVFQRKLSGLPVKLVVSQNPELDIWLSMDDVRIRQILYNLLENAMKFTGEGEIRLTIAVIPEINKSTQTLSFVVEDTGIGIPEDCQKLVFNTGYKTKPVSDMHRMGYGLGLQIIKKLVDCMGGSIKLTSNPEQGTRFEITLPGIMPADKAVNHKSTDSAGNSISTLSDRNILIVDDSELNRRLLAIMLREFDFITFEAEDGAEGLEMVRRNPPDLILMDLYMPNMDGYQTLKKLKRNKKTSEIPVVVVTASASEEEKENVYSAGFDSYITKPVSKELLLKEISRLIGKRAVTSS